MDSSCRWKLIANCTPKRALSMIAWALVLIATSAASFAQVKSPGAFSFATASLDAVESQGNVLITVIRTNGLDGKMTVDVGVIGKADGVSLTNATLVFNDFQASAQLAIPLVDDAKTNALKKVVFSLSNPQIALGDPSTVPPTLGKLQTMTLNIADNDTPMQFNFSSVVYYASESGGSAQLVIQLPDAPPSSADGVVSVDYTASGLGATAKTLPGNDKATEGLDFELTSGTATFDSLTKSVTISIPILADNLVEFNEEFLVTLSNPQGAVNTGTADSPTNVNFALGTTRIAHVVIQFNGDATAPQPAGALDQTYNPDNDLDTVPPNNANPGPNDVVYGTAITSTGKQVVVGTFTSFNGSPRNRVAQLNADGSVDEGFDPGLGANDYISAVALHRSAALRDRVVVVGGFNAIGSSLRNSIARLNTNGLVDVTFDPGSGADGPIYAVSIDGSDRILIAGDFTLFDGVPRNRIARLLSDGSIDTSFDPGDGPNGTIYSLLDQPFEPITLSANFLTNAPPEYSTEIDARASSGFVSVLYDFGTTPDSLHVYSGTNLIFNSGVTNLLVVITNLDGTAVTNSLPITASFPFGPGASTKLRFVVNEGNTNDGVDFVFSATVIPSGSPGLFIGGDFTSISGIAANRLARLNFDGTLDQSFSPGAGADNSVYSIASDSAGRLYVGGVFQRFNGQVRPNLVRVLADGAVDRSFQSGSGPDSAVQSVIVDGQGKVYLVGNFNSYDTSRRVNIARLLSTGALDTSFMDTAYNQYAGFPDLNGFAPNGVLNSISLTPDGGVLVGGSFKSVGGGATRASKHNRSNLAKLVGGSINGPGNIQLASNSFSADEGGGVLAFSLTRTGGDLGTVVAVATTVDGSALKGLDYTDFTGIGLWENGSTTNLVGSVVLNDDTIIEGDEVFSLNLDRPLGAVNLGGELIPTIPAFGGVKLALATIIDNDKPGSTLNFSSSAYEVNEGDGSVSVSVTRSGNVSGAVSVQFTTTGGTAVGQATEGLDFTVNNGTLNFKNGETNKTFSIQIRDDINVEVDESIALSLHNIVGTGASFGAISNAVLTIIDNDFKPGVISLSTTATNVAEAGGKLIVVAKRLGGSVGVIQADYYTLDQTATAGADYTASSGTLVWNDGDTQPKLIELTVANDGLVEGAETFVFALTNAIPAGALGTKSNLVVTILDDDAYGKLQFNATALYADENGLNAVVQVVRREGMAGTVSVDYAAAPTTAIAGKDFQPVSGTLIFQPGEIMHSFTVPILDDNLADGDRLVSLKLSSPTNSTLGTPSVISLTIFDNETKNIPAGSVDTDFAAGPGANGTVYDIKPQSDGSIFVGGDFTQINGEVQNRVAKLDRSGSLILGFAADLAVNASVRVLGVSPTSGKVLPGGAFTEVSKVAYRYLTRLSILGTVDNSFNPGSGTDSPVLAVAEVTVNGERKTLVAGGFSSFNGYLSRGIARVNDGGTADRTFNTGGGVNGIVYAMVVQRDGRILIGGDFLAVGGVAVKNLARLNSDGSLDRTFDTGLGADDVVRALALQDDDSILVGGSFHTVSGAQANGIARLGSSGEFDHDFTSLPGAVGPVYAIALQADGQILVGGDFTSFHGLGANRLVRLTTEGKVDPSINFGTGANGFISTIAVQADRRILIGGGFTEFNGTPRARLARIYGGSLSGSGQLEFSAPEFSAAENVGNALVTIRRTGGTVGNVGVSLQSTGITAFAGVDYLDVSTNLTFAEGETFKSIPVPLINNNIADPDRTLRLTLSDYTGGVTAGNQPFTTLTIINEDTVVGFTEGNFGVGEAAVGGGATITVRRDGVVSVPLTVFYSTSSGTATSGLDYTDVFGTLFFPKGVRTATFSVPIIDDLLVEGNETLSLSLTTNGVGSVILDKATAVLTIFDNDFAPGVIGMSSSSLQVGESAGFAVVTVNRTGGKSGSVAVDYTTVLSTATPVLDFTPVSGQLVFQDGEVSRSISIPIAQDVKVEPTEYFTIQLSNATGGATLGLDQTLVGILDDDFGPGSFDKSFSVGSGAANNADGSPASVRSLVLLPDQRVLLGGNFDTFGNVSTFGVSRVLSNGVADTVFHNSRDLGGQINAVSGLANGGFYAAGDFVGNQSTLPYAVLFTSNGVYNTAFSKSAGLNGKILAAVAQGDGKLIIGGSFTNPVAHLARLTAEGGLDVSFNVEGGTDGEVDALLLQPDGKIIVGGTFTKLGGDSVQSLARVSSTGVFDTNFVRSGVAGSVLAIALQADGKILIGGEFTSVGGVSKSRLARLNADGSLDTTFSGVNAPNGSVRSLAVAADGKVLVGGDFLKCGNVDRVRVARFNTDGTLDTVFDPGLGADAAVLALGIQADGQILVAGDFTTLNGFTSPGLARLNGDQPQPAQPFRITGAKLLDNQSLQITIASEAGRHYLLQGSSDFSQWSNLTEVDATTTSTILVGTPSDTINYRFYRVSTR